MANSLNDMDIRCSASSDTSYTSNRWSFTARRHAFGDDVFDDDDFQLNDSDEEPRRLAFDDDVIALKRLTSALLDAPGFPSTAPRRCFAFYDVDEPDEISACDEHKCRCFHTALPSPRYDSQPSLKHVLADRVAVARSVRCRPHQRETFSAMNDFDQRRLVDVR